MNWEKIDIMAIMSILRIFEKKSITIDDKHSITYSDGKEELKITYRKLE